MTIEHSNYSEKLDGNKEVLHVDIISKNRIIAQLHELKSRARIGYEEGVQPVMASLEKTTPFINLPRSMQELTSILELDHDILVNVSFSHFNPHQMLPETFSFGVSWPRDPNRIGTQIDNLHFNLEAQQSHSDFSASNRTLSARSDICFPYPEGFPVEEINNEDLPAQSQYAHMSRQMDDPEFSQQVIEEMITLFIQ